MSAEQPGTDADTLGRVAWEAGQAHMRERYGPRVGKYQWSEQVNPDQDGYRRIGQAVARVVLEAALAHLRRDLEWTRGRTRGETVRHVLDGYEDAVDELMEFAKQAGLEVPS